MALRSLRPAGAKSALAGQRSVVVLGAGPYGLSIAAHLRHRQVAVRVFGDPMASWRERMPRGMFLKSTVSASSIAAPRPGYELSTWCRRTGRESLRGHQPIPIDAFIDYGLWFQGRLVPDVERRTVVAVDRFRDGFTVVLDSGQELAAAAVVVATGLTYYAYVPPELERGATGEPSPAGVLSHSAQHHDLRDFAGRRVAVVGAGQSALETAALLHEVGADVRVLVRGPRAIFGSPPPDIDHQGIGTLLKPESPLGPGWSHFALSYAPALVRRLPLPARAWLVANILGPSGAWWLRERVQGRLPVDVDQRIRAAFSDRDQVTLEVDTDRGARSLTVDHVIAATGYRVAVDALDFLAPPLRAQIARADGAPRLGASFQSSVPGLYFSGLAAALTFGPLMRFVAGTAFAARRISHALTH
jgi:cation diffusion facilitator CzcD-associated flavoprotein CzcO